MKKDIYPQNLRMIILTRLFVSTLVGMLMSVLILPANAQTVLISPTGNGGFESGTTFPANGWTLVNASSGNSWCVGTVATSAGARGAYISTSSSGSNNNYNKGFSFPSASRVVHFYRDVTFPAGETSITLSFKWKNDGQTNADDISVFLANTSLTPTSGNEVASGNLIAGPYDDEGANFQTVTISIPGSNAGTTKRLIFSWRNNNSSGTNPAGAFDEISLTTCAPPIISASNNGPVCPGGTLNLSASGGGTYLWDGPGGFTSTSANPIIPGASTGDAGLYTVTVTTSGCSASTTTTASITTAPSGAAPSATVVSACAGAAFGLNANIGLANSSTNTANFSIPDNNTTGISSPIVVSGGFVANNVINVTLNITHPYVADLDIFLKAPNGSQIELSSDNGGSGNNYTNTVFETGGSSITSGSAPFTGTYSPEQPFSSLTGSANGTWYLVVEDDAWLSDTGTLLDWTITITSTSGVTYTWSSTPSGFSSSSATTNDFCYSKYNILCYCIRDTVMFQSNWISCYEYYPSPFNYSVKQCTGMSRTRYSSEFFRWS